MLLGNSPDDPTTMFDRFRQGMKYLDTP
jgi:hypothetical protein